jgi:tetratricopeptide (TPR) repeat protein/transcriptional regulator with XRE-family HTH domain
MVPASTTSLLAFGPLLKRHRRTASMTQAQLAERAGFTAVYISMLERGVRRPLHSTVALLAEALELSAEERATLETAAHLPSRNGYKVVTVSDSARPRLPIGGFLGAEPEGALIDREAERERLLAVLDAVAGGAGRLVLLAGEPGVGKTRLAQEVVMRARERGFLVATGRCYEPQENVPYYPFLEALTKVYADAPTALRAEVPRRWVEISRMLRDPGIDVPISQTLNSGRDDQQRLFWQATGFLQALADERPVALFVDDLHWADHASIDLLLHLAHYTRASKIMLVGTYRDDEVRRQHPLEGAMRDLARDHLLDRIRVQRLSFEDTWALIAATLGDEATSDEFARLLHARTEGNPFFTQEVVRALLESGDEFRHEGKWDLTAIKELEIPESVRSVIGQRFSRLSSAAQGVLYEASVLGQTFAFKDLQTMDARSEATVEAALEEGLAARLVHEADGDRFGFHHALVQEVLYRALTGHKRRRLHRMAGEAIERFPEHLRVRRSADLAYHFLAADERERALPYVLQAGAQAEALYAHSEAESHYRAAAAVASVLGDQSRVAEALEKVGNVQFFIARFDNAMAAYGQAAQAYRAADDILGLRRVTARLARIFGCMGDLERGRALLQSLLDSTPLGEPAASVADMYVELAWLCSDPEERLAACERASEIARAIGDNHTLALAEFARANTLNGQLGRIEEARQTFEDIIPLLEAAGDLRRLCSTLNVTADAYLRSGDFGAARQYADRALEVTEQLGVPAQLAWTYCNHGDVAYHAGDWRQAYLDYERGDAIYRSAGHMAESGYARWGMGQVCLARGEIEEASRLLEEAITCTEAHEDEEAETLQVAHAALAERDLMAGRPKAACARIEQLVERLQQKQGLVTRVLPLLAWAYLELGDGDRAESLAQDAISGAAAGPQRLALVEALRIRGMIATRRKQWKVAETALKEALALSKAMPYPYAEARILYTFGLLHLEHKELELALKCLRAARDICTRLGEQLYHEHIARRLIAVERV